MAREGYIELQGRQHPLYATILAEAHERGLQAIETQLIQVPNADNDYTAIVKATVRLKDGSEFSDYGDASPRNCNSKVALALIRMASTRGKGRALRDAVNIGATMLEELGGDEPDASQPMTETQRQGWSRQAAAVQATNEVAVCSEPGCGTVLKKAQVTFCQQRFAGRLLCSSHQSGVGGN